VCQRRRPLCVAIRAACLAATLPAILPAQASHGTIEVGAARLSQRDVPATGAATLGASFRHDAARFAFAAAGGVTLAGDGRSTSQGLLAASVLGRPGWRTRWEIGGALTAFDQGTLTAGAYLLAREHFAVGRFGGWAGVAIGGVEEVDEEMDWWSPTRSAELGAWYRSRFARLTGSVVLVDTRSEPYGPVGQLVTDPVTYTDGSIGARWIFRQRAEVDARAGLRFISRGALTATGRGTRPFAAVDAQFWLTPHLAVAVGAGRQLSDLARGTPDTRFATVALRWSVGDQASRPRPVPRPVVGDRPRLTLVTDTSAQPRLIVTVSRGALVELAASFTSWEPVPLVRRRGHWELDRRIPSGAHRVLIRVDGGPWVVPANVPATADDFGGTVGVITVP
jgi:hypothetical protein